ncbi:MAG: PAS domain-containing protein [Alphaproteobacteria bacterium]|nr:PAS domain-containing protein [Alphaproteobacteria bacterium]
MPRVRSIHILALTPLIAAPAWLTLVMLALIDTLPAAAMLAAGALALLPAAALAWYAAALIELVRAALSRLAADGPEAVAAAAIAEVLFAGPLVHGTARVAQAWERDRAALESRVATARAMVEALPDPLLALDAGRRIVFANSAACRLLKAGRRDGGTDGRDLSAVLRPPSLLGAVDAVLAGDGEQAAEFTLAGPVERTFAVRIEPVAATAGDGGTRVLVVLRDVTADRRGDAMRVDFVANVSHELRTPLASLVGFIETLQGAASDDAAARTRFLALMGQQARRMTRLVADLLSLSRIEMREHTVPEHRIEIAGVLETVASLLAPRAEGRDMTIERAFAADAGAVTGDREELVQLAHNLVENALKYGRAGTAVTLAAERRGDRLLLRVTDRGEGIAAEHIPRLTERFYRVDTARSRELGGTGLGLAIVKHIASRHLAQLRVTSTQGEGSTFTVDFPALPAAPEGGRDALPQGRSSTVTRP